MPQPAPIREPADTLFESWCRRGDARALGELFDALAPRLLKLAIHLVGDAAEAEDLVQATFLVAIERRKKVDPSLPVMPWLTGVLANQARQHRRRAARVPEPPRLAPRAVEDASGPLERRELDDEVARAIDALEEPYRSAVLLRVRHGMDPADIAHVLGREPGTVRVQLHRGLEQLRAALPAALLASLALVFSAPRGLAAVKAAVLQGAAADEAGAGTGWVVGGMLVSKKVVVAVVMVLVAVVLWSRRLVREGHAGGEEAASTLEAPALLVERPVSVERPSEVPAPVVEATSRTPAEFASGVTLHGRVIDAETRAPIPGASLRFFPPRETDALALLRERPELYESEVDGELRARTRGDWPLLVASSMVARFGREELLVYDRPEARDEPIQTTNADEEGNFTFVALPGPGVLEGAHAGHATRWQAMRDMGEELTLELWREREVRGVVIGPDGEPLHERIEFAIVASKAPDWKPPELVDLVQGVHFEATAVPGVEWGAGAEGLGAWRVQTDESGSFHTSVGAPSISIAVLSPRWSLHSWSNHELDGSEIQVWVYPAVGFHVFDAASHEPIELVNCLGVERANQYVRWSGRFRAPQGWLAIPGDWSYVTSNRSAVAFTLWSEGHHATTLTLPDVGLAGIIEVPLERGDTGAFRGRVTRAGAPVRGAEVVLLGHSPLQWDVHENHAVDATRTDSDGRFEFDAPDGSYVLRLRAADGVFLEKLTRSDRPNFWLTQAIEGREPYFQVVELPSHGLLAIDLAGASTVEVEVVDAHGAPRLEHVVALRGPDGRQSCRYTDAEGRLRFRNLPAGRYTLHTPDVSAFGSFAGGQLREIELAAGSLQRERFALPDDSPRHVRVTARGTASYAGWRGRFEYQDWNPLAADGTVPMDLATNRFELEIAASDGRAWHLQVPREAKDGDVIELEDGAGIYRGVLRRADGSPWPSVSIHAVPWGSGGSGTRIRVADVTDARGEFELTGLSASEYRLRFQTNLERGLWDEGGNELDGISFAPAQPASAEGTFLAIQIGAILERVRVRGVVVDSAGAPVRDVRIFFQAEAWAADGVLIRELRGYLTLTDASGSFELDLPRAPRIQARLLRKDERHAARMEAFVPSREVEEFRWTVP